MTVQFVNPFLGSAAEPSHDYFGADGSTLSFHGWTFPNAIYDAGTGMTWIAWESYTTGGRGIRVTGYHHPTRQWMPDAWVGSHPLVNDGHGPASLMRDDEGYLHAFYGGHATTVFESVSRDPDDNTHWLYRNTFVGAFTYPHPCLVDGVVHLFMRETLGSSMPFVVSKTMALSGGVATWGTKRTIIEFGAGTRVYVAATIIDGTDIHFVAVKTPYSGTTTVTNVYHFIYDTTDGSIRNADGSADIAVGSQPILLATADASFRVVAQTTTEGTYPGFCIDTSGKLHIAYFDGNDPSFSLKHVVFSGGSWSAPTTITTLTQSPDTYLALVTLPAGEVAVYYPLDTGGSWARGGDMMRRVRSAGGSWGSAETVLAASTYALEQATPVRDAHPNARLVFSEVTQSDADTSGGDLKMYLVGDGGFVTRPVHARPTAITLSSTTVYAGAGIGDLVALLAATDSDPGGDTFTWRILSDPDGKFAIDGNRLELADTVSFPGSHSATIRATDSAGHTLNRTVTITVVAAVIDLNDGYFDDAVLVLDGERPGSGTDASLASVQLLIDVA